MKIAHVVLTDAFAGTERYVAEVSRRQAQRGHEVVVVGGPEDRFAREVRHLPTTSVLTAVARLRETGPHGVVHAHLTHSETAALLYGVVRRTPVVSTRHIAKLRGSSVPVRLLSPLFDRALSAQIAISEHVAQAMHVPAVRVLPNGVARSEASPRPQSRQVLMLQRLASEKQTGVALDAWEQAQLPGWTLVVAGHGAQRENLEGRRVPGVEFVGLVDDPQVWLADSALLLATAPSEPLGLSVLEAMAAGVPVLAARGGGHLETLGPDHALWFPPGDSTALARALEAFAQNGADGEPGRARQRELFDLDTHVDQLVELYAEVSTGSSRS